VGCYCAYVTALETRTRVLVLQHPRERDKAVGTVRIAALCLPTAEVFVGVDFSAHARLNALLSDAERPAVLLYPGPDARDLAREPPSGPVNLVVIDGTWHQARALLRRNPRLRKLAHYAFSPQRPSEYRIRREPRGDYVSTVEALAVALSVLEDGSQDFQALLAPFRAMVSVQLDFAARSAGGRQRTRRRGAENPRVTRGRLPGLLLEPGLLCVGAEANAWPHDRARGGPPYPHELVHWLALRPHDHTRFEALLAPRLPLARSPVIHAQLDAGELSAGLQVADFLEAWHAFARPDDVLCAWGHYGTDLLRREGGVLPERSIDLRKVAGDYLKRRPGSLEELVLELSLAWTARGRGRGGARLGMLEAVARFLVREARRESVDAPEANVDAGGSTREQNTETASETQSELGVQQ
jgi:DTW domain-containing protein YfiP